MVHICAFSIAPTKNASLMETPREQSGRGAFMAQQRMLSFVSVEQETPDKRDAAERRGDFHEIYADYIAAKANEQASRCSQCGVPFCQTHCPLGNNIPDWLMLTATGRLEEAYELSAATSNMPEVCGRICPQDRLCEGGCVIEQSGHGSVTIGAVEKYITDTAWEKGWVQPIKPHRELGQSIGIIGAGPAGLSAADQLRSAGYKVTVYDRHDRAGGLLIYGIPNFKLEKEVVERRTKRLADGGVMFKLGVDIGKDISFAELRNKHDADPRRHRRLQIARTRNARRVRQGRAEGARLSDRRQQGRPWRRGRRLHERQAQRRQEERRRHRRRRHGDGLRAHGDPPGREIRHLPLSPRPRQHAGLAARSRQCRGRRREVRLAGRAPLRRREKGRRRESRARRPHAPRPA
jgi:hypothetical protein